MPVRNLLPIVLLLAATAAGCSGSPTQAEGTVTVTQTTSTTTSTTTTTTTIPQLIAGSIGTSPSGVGLAFATVYSFFVSPPSGGVPPYTFTWAFGDGGEAAGGTPSHAYTNSGTFTARATTTDSRGMTAVATASISVRNVTGRWTAKIDGTALNPEPIDMVQNQTALTATVNSTNGFGLATGTGNVSNPRNLSLVVTYTAGAPFAATYLGRVDDSASTWSGTVTGYAGCPCTFTATRPPAVGDSVSR